MARARKRRLRTVGAIVVNPRKRKTTTKRRRTVASKRRRNPVSKRRVSTQRRRVVASKRRRNPARKRKAAPRVRRVARKTRARKNPAVVSSLQRSLKKVPLFGGALATMAGLALPAALGGLSVELPIQAAGVIRNADWAPGFIKGMSTHSYLFAGGLVTAAIAHKIAPTAWKKDLALATAAAGAGAGYFAMRQKQMADAAGVPTVEEQVSGDGATNAGLGALVVAGRGNYGRVIADYGAVHVGNYGMGPAYSVQPGYGAVLVGS